MNAPRDTGIRTIWKSASEGLRVSSSCRFISDEIREVVDRIALNYQLVKGS